MKKLISIVIPVFRNQGSIDLTYEKVVALFHQEALKDYNYQFVFVNDGSDDESWEEILKIKKKDAQNVHAISFSRNFGQVPAIIAGYRKAKGDACINMSADLQDPPEVILKMIKSWEEDSKIVIAFREGREDNFVSRFTSRLFYKLINYGVENMPIGGFDFVLLDRKVVDQFNLIDERNRFFQGDILWMGFPITFMPYKRLTREIGTSQWSLKKKIKYFLDGFLNTSYLPIRLMSLIGLSISIMGLVYSLVIIINRFFNNTPYDGWAPIMVIMLITSGFIMIMLGIIGEYIWRIYDEARNREYFIIDKELPGE